jgi:nucleotide-binding universal stress UspA family protein
MYMEVVRKDQYTLLCVHSPPVSDEWVTFTDYIGGLLESRPVHRGLLEPSSDHRNSLTSIEPVEDLLQPSIWLDAEDQEDIRNGTSDVSSSDSDLVVVNDSQPLWWQRLLKQVPAKRILQQIPGSILFARNPRWPLRHILIVVRAHATDELALKWAERLAIPSEAKVTLLPIVPPHPRLHQNDGNINEGLDALMAPNTCSGEALQRYARRLDQLNLHGTVCWKQGNPEHQIRQEVRARDHDLIVIADEPFGRFSRWLLGELVGPLLGESDRPVLIAR